MQPKCIHHLLQGVLTVDAERRFLQANNMTTEAEKERRRKLVKRAIYEIDETGLSSASKSAYR